MAGQSAALGILRKHVRVDCGKPGLFGVGRRQAHRFRNVQHQIKIEIGRQRGARCRGACHRHFLLPDHFHEDGRHIGTERDAGSQLDAGFCDGAGTRQIRVTRDRAHVAVKDVVGLGDAGRNRAIARHCRSRGISGRFLGKRGHAGGVGRGLQLRPHSGRHRVVHRATHRRDQRYHRDPENHRDIGAFIPAETVDQAKETTHVRGLSGFEIRQFLPLKN